MERNIFEAAANKLSKNPKTPEKAKKTDPIPHAPSPQSAPISHDPEISSMVDQMRKMKLDLETQITKMYEMGRQYNFDVDSYLERKFHLSPKDLEKMVEKGKKLENQFKENTLPQSGFTKRQKSKEALEKERKSKTLGARKKNWISVH